MQNEPPDDFLTVALPPGINLTTTDHGLMLRGPRGLLEALALEMGWQRGGVPEEPEPAPRTPPHGPSGLAAGAVHDDDSPLWSLLATHHRYQDPRFAPDEPALALDALRAFSPRARKLLLDGTAAHPGVLLTAEEAAQAAGVDGPFAVAGVLNGFVGGCEATGRAFPVWAFERPGTVALYGTPPSAAAAFTAADVAGGGDRPTIQARRNPRWWTEVIPASVELLADAARQRRTMRYLEFADAVHAAVPDARPRHRGKGGVSWLLADLLERIRDLNPELPLLTSVVVGADGRPASGFTVQWREFYGADRPLDHPAEQEACAVAYTPDVVERLVRHLRSGG